MRVMSIMRLDTKHVCYAHVHTCSCSCSGGTASDAVILTETCQVVGRATGPGTNPWVCYPPSLLHHMRAVVASNALACTHSCKSFHSFLLLPLFSLNFSSTSLSPPFTINPSLLPPSYLSLPLPLPPVLSKLGSSSVLHL